MSDKKLPINYIVKVCRKCQTVLSMFVILCRTMSNSVLAVEIDWVGEIEIVYNERDTQTDRSIPQEGIKIEESTPEDIITPQDPVLDFEDNDLNTQISHWDTQERDVLELSPIVQWDWVIWSWEEMLIIDDPLNGIDESSLKLETKQDWAEDVIQSFRALMSNLVLSPPQISITEVRIDGTDEYIELTNRGEVFSGEIVLSWVKSSLLSVTIHLNHNESIIIGDTLSIVQVSWYTTIANQWLSMTDTASRSLQVLYDWQVIDSLTLSSSQVASSDNQSASREYDATQQLRQITTLAHTRNMQSGQLGNPWIVRGLTAFDISSWSSNTGIVTTWSIGTWIVISWTTLTWSVWSGIIDTWATLSGNTVTGSILTWANMTGSIQIQQVYPFADCIGEHIALFFSAPYQGNLTIQWLGTSDSPKSFDITVTQPWIRYIVESLSGVLSDNVILVPSITLTDGGESLILKDAWWQVLDSIIYSNTQAGSASMVTNTSGNIRIFNTNLARTIATSCSQSHALPQMWWCRIQMSDSLYDTWVFVSTVTVSGSLVSAWCTESTRSVNGTQLSNNTCGLSTSLTAWSHRIVYQQFSGSTMICEDEIMFYGAIQAQSVAQNILPTTSSTCASSDRSYYEWLYRKRKIKHGNLSNAVEYVWLTVTNNDDVYGICDQSILSWNSLVSRMDPSKSTLKTRMMEGSRQLIVYDIIADGTGNDRGGTESVTIFNDSDSLIDLEWVMLVVNNKAVDILSGTLWVNSFLTLTDYFPLPNAWWCIALYHNGAVYDQVCYGKFTDKHVINMETLKLPKSFITKTTKSTTKKASETSGTWTIDWLYTLKSCLKLEEYDLLRLDIKEQTLINKAQKSWYKLNLDKYREKYRSKTDELYQTYRSITDKKQAYIDRQQSFIDSQKSYIDKLKSQISSCSSYSTRITKIYNNNKSYTETLKTSRKELYDLKSQITNNYPALTNDPAIAAIIWVETWSNNEATTSLSTQPKPTASRRITVKQTIAHLF